MKFSFELKAKVAVEKVWSLYADVNKWFSWEADLEEISLLGDFVQGTSGKMKLAGQPSMDYDLVSVVSGEEFTNRTIIPTVGDIYFIHELIEKDDHLIIKHSVEFIPSNREATVEDSRFIAQIFSGVPAAVFSLVQAANE